MNSVYASSVLDSCFKARKKYVCKLWNRVGLKIIAEKTNWDNFLLSDCESFNKKYCMYGKARFISDLHFHCMNVGQIELVTSFMVDNRLPFI